MPNGPHLLRPINQRLKTPFHLTEDLAIEHTQEQPATEVTVVAELNGRALSGLGRLVPKSLSRLN